MADEPQHVGVRHGRLLLECRLEHTVVHPRRPLHTDLNQISDRSTGAATVSALLPCIVMITAVAVVWLDTRRAHVKERLVTSDSVG